MSRHRINRWAACSILLALLSPVGFATLAWAQKEVAAAAAVEPEAVEAEASVSAAVTEAIDSKVGEVQQNLNIVWTILSAALVFWMGAGFAMLEGGFTRAKNAGNIMAKNLMTISVAAVAYWAAGFACMFGISSGLMVGASEFFLNGFDHTTGDGQWGYTFWMFQVVFAGTAATIVSGAVAERTKFSGYLVYTFVIGLFIYPVFGHWAWGTLYHSDNAGAWLGNRGFIDFAGSTVVHSVGGWSALAGAIVVGPRLGKFARDRMPRVIPGHSMTLATLGVFILFLGWFGFNAGSTTTGTGDIARIAVNTFLAGCTGSIGALFTSWLKVGRPDVGMALNGALAGLVAITAPCYTVTPLGAVIIGTVGGVLVVFSVLFFDNIGVDDPVGAISVHLVNGIWGTLAAALLHENLFLGLEYDLGAQLWTQVLGILTCGAWTFSMAYLMFRLIRATIGLRVSEAEEIEGLDLGEHGSRAYPDFVQTPSSGGMGLTHS